MDLGRDGIYATSFKTSSALIPSIYMYTVCGIKGVNFFPNEG